MSEAGYLAQIRQLVELQKVDDEIFDVKQILKNAPANLVELERKKDEVESRRQKVIDKLEYIEEQRKRVFQEIDEHSDKMKKSDDKMMQIGTSREYQALMREKDSLEKTYRMQENEKTTLLEEMQYQTEAKAEIDKEYEKIRSLYDKKKSNLDKTLSEASAKLEKLEAKRAEASSYIPRPKLMRYEFIRKRLEHPVIVEVDDGICSGCHIAIPPQTYIELQAGQQILSCPNCQRLIFWSQHFDMPSDRPKPAKKPRHSHEEETEEQAELEEIEMETEPEEDRDG